MARSALRRYAFSRSVAVGVMLAMGLVLGLAGLVDPTLDPEAPSRGAFATWVAEHLKPEAVAAHPAFKLLPAYLFIGILVSIVDRVRQYRAGQGSGPGAGRFKVERTFTLPSSVTAAEAHLQHWARKAGYHALRPTAGGFEAGRGRAGFFGSLVFHVGLLVTVAGIVASTYTRFHAQMVLAEGFPKPLSTESLVQPSHVERFQPPPGYSLSIRDFVADYSSTGSNVDFSLLLSLRRGDEEVAEQEVRVNQAFDWKGFQLTLYRYGFAPDVVVTAPDGTKLADASYVLVVVPPGRPDAIPFEGGGEMQVQLFPDFVDEGGQPASRSRKPRQPVIAFALRDPAGRSVGRGLVGVGQTTVVNGYSVRFNQLSYWAGFIVARDQGLWLFAVGSVLAAFGLGTRFAVPDQRLKITWQPSAEGTRCHLTAGTRFFPALHEERIDRLVKEIEEEAAREHR